MARHKEARPSRPRDLVLSHMQVGLLRRWIALWKRSGTSLDLFRWTGERLDVLAMDEWDAQRVRGVNAPTRPGRKQVREYSGLKLNAEEVVQVKEAVVAGKIKPDSPMALAAAAAEQGSHEHLG